MRLLLDTHVLLWWLDDPTLIVESAREAIAEPNNDVFVSSVSVWEVVLKRSLGKLNAPHNLPNVIAANGFRVLPVTIDHALATESLPWHHRDPFDRMLVAQAIAEGMSFLRDKWIREYNVPIVLA